MKNIHLLFLSALLATAACRQPLINETVTSDFEQRTASLPCQHPQEALALAASEEAREALTFLYAYMSWPDVADYSPEYHLQQTECALRARQEMAWGQQVPDREWLHFVLPVRVNNEPLDTFRTTCYEELKERVAGLSMYDAVLEVNHWCHEHVTYQPSDARTSSPLQSIRTGYGRCGEESTLTVAALRTVGIPARQVYTPRWAHTDDNHAWVEAWVDGKWYFLGACEPEPVLNLGWFNQPASRGMLMHTKVFGHYDGPEDVMQRNACYTEINVTDNYADVARTTVRVVNGQQQPVAGARVEFKLYNYAELFTVMTTQTDATGHACITTGLGDFVAWATDGQHFGFQKITAGKDTLVELSLNHRAGEPFLTEMNITPPAGKNNLPQLDSAAVAANSRRLAYEDSLRAAYATTFPDSAATAAFCRENGLDFKRLYPLVRKSHGNHAQLLALCKKYKNLALDWLGTVSDKDLRDFSLSVAEDHLKLAPAVPSTYYLRYVLCPRIANEPLTPWRGYFHKVFTDGKRKHFHDNPAELAAWVRDSITTDTVWNPTGLCLSPESAHRYAFADNYSKGLLFVAAARSCDIPARIDPVTGKVQYDANTNACREPAGYQPDWTTVELDNNAAPAASSPSGKVRLDYTPREYMENPNYYSHFTISKIENGMPRLLEYGGSWDNPFRTGVNLDAGIYLLTSGTRMADGGVLARFCGFPVEAGKDTAVTLVMREDKQNVAVIGSFNSENKYFDVADQCVKSILSTTGRGYFVVGLIRANHEPTNHILHDIEKLKTELEAWGRTLLLLFPSSDEYERFCKNRAEFTQLPSNLRFGIDTEGQIAADFFGSGLTHTRELPIVVIGDTFNRVVFKTQGYTIGLGEQLKQVIGKL